jgi:hypothetical protein
VLHEEIGRLPEWCRAAFVLCHVEGKTAAEAAALLGCPRGTVLSRLARARQRLAARLRGRGIHPSLVAGLGTGMAGPSPVATGAGTGAFVRLLFGGKMVKMTLCSLLGYVVVAGMGGSPPCAPRPEAVTSSPPARARRLAANPGEAERAAPYPQPRDEAPAPDPEPKPAPASRLDTILQAWSRSSAAARKTRSPFRRTMNNRIFEEKTQCKGEVRIVQPGWLRIDTNEADGLSTVIVTPQAVHFFNAKTSTELILPPRGTKSAGRAWPVPQVQAALREHAWLYGGCPPPDLTRRFDVSLVKEDNWYVYLNLLPRHPDEKQSFSRLRIVLARDGWWVRQVWFEHTTGNETAIDFPHKPKPDAGVTRASLRRELPRGWERVDLTAPAK